mmetsp:Transcript_9391/g.34835  ORF Transcript_9391/g.34835 Transcript_9391/m.34835 type:complete len:211 (-) Transcript_9391:2052-2684(-)
MMDDLLVEEIFLLWSSIINTSLQHTATVLVRGNLHTSTSNCVVNELLVLGTQFLQASLNHMVSIQILDERNNVAFQGACHQFDLLGSTDALNKLLNCSGTVHIRGNFHEIIAHSTNDFRLVYIIAMLHQFLAQIVSKWIGHELRNVREYLVENCFHFFCSALLELLLEESASVLILSKLIDATLHLLHRGKVHHFRRRRRRVARVARLQM